MFFRHLCFLSFLALGAVTLLPATFGTAQSAHAQTASTPATDNKTIRSQLEKHKAALDIIEKSLNGDAMTGEQLQAARAQISPLTDAVQQGIADIAPRIAATKARLDQLGPKPKEGDPAESPEVANERAEKEATYSEFLETERLGKVNLVQAEQLMTELSDKRRALFQRQIFGRTTSIANPELWFSVVTAIPQEMMSVRGLISDWLRQIRDNATLGSFILFGLALLLWFGLFAGKPLLAGKLIKRDPDIDSPAPQKKLLAAVGVFLLRSVPIAIGAAVVYSVLLETSLLPERMLPVLRTFLMLTFVFAAISALSDAVLAPSIRSWRLMAITDASASRLHYYIMLIVLVAFAGKITESFYQALNVALPISVASRGAFSLAVAGILLTLLLHFAIVGKTDEENLAVFNAMESEAGGPLRMIAWLLIIAIVGTALFGYIALSSFLVDQGIWVTVLYVVLRLALSVIEIFLSAGSNARYFLLLQANTGLSRGSLEQIAVLVNGVLRIFLIFNVVMLALVPWGIESFDYAALSKSAFFGFNVGGITISVSTIILAVGLFAFGFAATRLFQRWLDSTYLPVTKLDAGLRNSIKTGVGYVGIIFTGFATLNFVGISLDKITTLAAALSVGIGFGLQAIVNNFVSGLILLWERPIRVGDLVVVGDGEGHVRRINVRSTEILTSDRTTIIVPNSNLISGVVRNRVRGDRMGRIVIALPVNRGVDPDELAAVVKKCALDHREIASAPAPAVLFKKIGESTLDFELVCFVEEIEVASRVSSELHFAIFRTLREAGIISLPSPTTIQIKGLEPVTDSINALSGKRTPPRSPVQDGEDETHSG